MISGSSFYVEDVDKAFIGRVYNWLNYLEIAQFFPDLDRLDNIKAVGSTLRDIGEERLYGMADKKTGRTIIRPGDFVTLLHELYHVNRAVKGSALDSEAGALAAQVFSTGDYKRSVEDFLHAKYKDEEKRAARVLTEAILVGGRDVFDWLGHLKNKTDYVNLVHYLGERINEFERRYRSKSPLEYLIETHRIPEQVAQRLIKMTGHDSDTMVRSTDDTKKNMLGAFKGLASFLHINLDYSLDEAIARTVQMFEDEEALTINQTLYHGSKEVFARFEEYGVPREFTVQLARKLITDGSDRARLYADTFPKLLDFSQRFGPGGWHFLGRTLKDPGFTYALLAQNVIEGLNSIYDKDPSIIPSLLESLLELNWSFDKTFGKVSIHDPTSDFRFLPFELDIKTRARILAATIALYCMDSETIEKLEDIIPVDLRLGMNLGAILEPLYLQTANPEDEKTDLKERIDQYFEAVKSLLPTEEMKELRQPKNTHERLSELGLYGPRGEPPNNPQ